MQNSESVKIAATTVAAAAAAAADATTITPAADATTIISTPSSPIQEAEGSHHEPLVSLSPELEIKSTGDDDAEMDQKPSLVGVGHKRKASTEIDPFCESDPKTSLGSKRISTPPVSTPDEEQHQVDEEMLTQEGGESEQAVEGDLGLSADEGLEDMESDIVNKIKGTVKAASNIDEEQNVEINDMNIESEGDKGVSDGGLVEMETEENKEEADILNSQNNAEEEEDAAAAGTESMNAEEAESEENEGEESVNSPNEAENEKVEADAIESVPVDGKADIRKVPEIDLNRNIVISSPTPADIDKGIKVENREGIEEEAEGNMDTGPTGFVRLLGIDLNVAAEGAVQSPRVDLNGDNGIPDRRLSMLDLNANANDNDNAVKIQETHSVGGGCIVFEYPYVAGNVVGAKNPTGIDLMATPPPFDKTGMDVVCKLNQQQPYPFYHHKSEMGDSSGGAADEVEHAEGGGPETEPEPEPEPEPVPEPPAAQHEARASSDEDSPPPRRFHFDLNEPPADWA